MREQSATRRELEEKMRALIPSRLADAASSEPRCRRRRVRRPGVGLPLGLAPRAPQASKEHELILRRLLRVVFRLSILRAWSRREARWLWITAGVLVVRFVQRSSERRRSRNRRRGDVSDPELREGERVMLIDAKDRRYLVTLRAGPRSTPTRASSSTTTSSERRRGR